MLHLLKTGQLVVRCPEFFQVRQVRQIFKLRDLVIGDVENVEVLVVFKTGDMGDGVVRDV